VPRSAFHPTVRAGFEATLGPPTPPQVRAWPAIATGRHVLVAAPTGSGKTLAAFRTAVHGLLGQGPAVEDHTSVLDVSPLKACGNDVQKNLLAPLAARRARDATRRCPRYTCSSARATRRRTTARP